MATNESVQRWLDERFVPAGNPYIKALDTMAYGYVVALLWSTNDESDPETGGDPLDETFSPEDMTDEFWLRVRQDVLAFAQAETFHIWRVDPNLAGHDLWLTRAGHGAGFWNGDWDRIVYPGAGSHLTKVVKATLKEVDVVVGDDGLLHFG